MGCNRKLSASGAGIIAVLIGLIVIGPAIRAEALTIIDNSAYMNNAFSGVGYKNSTFNDPFYGGGTYAYFGQVVTAPTNGDHHLQSFTFYVRPTTTQIAFRASVYEWTGSGLGHMMFAEDIFAGSIINRQSPNTFQPVTTFCGSMDMGIPYGPVVTPGQQYLLLLWSDPYFDSFHGDNYGDIGIVESATDSYIYGDLKYNQADKYEDWAGLPGHPGLSTDLAFTAVFGLSPFEESQPVPEPATMILLGTGLAGLAGIRRRMKR